MRESKVFEKNDLKKLCELVRQEVQARHYAQMEQLISNKMGQYPDAAVPHNLLGIILEKQNNHVLAMKHFRAAYALEPTYKAARYNICQYTSYDPTGKVAYDECDCLDWEEN